MKPKQKLYKAIIDSINEALVKSKSPSPFAGKIVEKKCNCGKTYKDYDKIEKRYMPVCDDCLPF